MGGDRVGLGRCFGRYSCLAGNLAQRAVSLVFFNGDNKMRKQDVVLLICLVSFALVATGCASIMCGSEKTVSIKSNPGSKFMIKDAKGQVIVEDTAPTNITLKRGRGWFQAGDYNVTFEKPGYEKTTVPINQGLEGGWYGLGNIVFGGLVGWVIVDPMTGAMWDIKDVNVSLEAVEPGAM